MSNMRKLDGHVPFYMAGQPKADPTEHRHAWHGPDQYLEEAIRTQASDLALEFLMSSAGVDVVSAMELHHQRHGEISWRHCRDVECYQLGLACAQIAVLETLRIERASG